MIFPVLRFYVKSTLDKYKIEILLDKIWGAEVCITYVSQGLKYGNFEALKLDFYKFQPWKIAQIPQNRNSIPPKMLKW